MAALSPERIYASAEGGLLEGLLENAQSRKDQIYALHAWLKEHSTELVENLRLELDWSTEEAIENLNTVLASAEQLYNGLSLQRDLRIERSVNRGGQICVHPRPLGVGLIVGSSKSPVSSVLLPLLSGLAAGCITITVTPEGTEKTSNLVLQGIAATTDHEGVLVSHHQHLGYFTAQHFDVVALPVDSKYDDSLHDLQKVNPSIRVLRPNKGKSFAIVDRSSDLRSAAVHLHRTVAGRTFLSSSRSPKVCLVDEFVIDAFELELGQLLGTKTEALAKGVTDGKKANGRITLEQASIQSSKYSSKIARLIRPEDMAFEDLRDVVSKIFVAADRVVLVPTTSTEHAIDLISAVNHPDLGQVLYIFSKSNEGGYFSKFVRTQQAFINAINLSSHTIEVPNTPTATLELPYSASDFTVNSPIYQSKPLAKSRNPKSSTLVSKTLSKVRRKEFLPPSFFVRGILLGLVMILAGTGGTTYGVVRLVRRLLKR